MGQILTATIERAVSKGWIPQGESSAVSQKIEAMGSRYGFNPDHFAVFTHIESFGMKPDADNRVYGANRIGCVGIIQFCPDNKRGYTKTIGGKSYNLEQVKQMSVLQQLDLVDAYLNGVIPSSMRSGLTLDHLYFFILYPSIGRDYPNLGDNEDFKGRVGDQAAYLYEGQVKGSRLTKVSVRQGLLKQAANNLGNDVVGDGGGAGGTGSGGSAGGSSIGGIGAFGQFGFQAGLINGACTEQFPVDFSLKEAITYTGCFNKIIGNVIGQSSLSYPSNGMRINGVASFTIADFNPAVPICPGCLAWPFKVNSITITSHFCVQRGSRYHGGTDYASTLGKNKSLGLEVLAVADGVVKRAITSNKYADYKPGHVDVVHEGLGNLVSRYGHIIPTVQPGQQVKQGDVVGKVGPFGNDAAHLHLELRKDKGEGYSPRSIDDCKTRFLSPELFIRKP